MPPEHTPRSGKPVVVVTGAAQGIGAHLVHSAVEAGWRVAALDVQDCQDAFADAGDDVLVHRVDITEEGQVRAALDAVEARFGRVDALVSAAALFTALTHKEFTEIGGAEWDRVFDVNVKGPFLLSKHVAPLLRRAGGGAIVHFASNVVSFGMANFLHYVASKSAIVGMTRSLARELGPDHIRVNSVSPGFIETEITERERDPGYRATLVSRQCIPVPMTPEDVCSTVLFLISPGARAITGQNILVNSGTHMGPA